MITTGTIVEDRGHLGAERPHVEEGRWPEPKDHRVAFFILCLQQGLFAASEPQDGNSGMGRSREMGAISFPVKALAVGLLCLVAWTREAHGA
jgi:hypothetical protein